MTRDHHQATLTEGEVAWLLHAGNLTPQRGSPLLALAEVEVDVDEASLRELGAFDPAWGAAVAVLAVPDRQIRTIIPGPAETLIQVFYGSRAQPETGLVGFWLEGDRLRVSFPWDEGDIAAITARVVLVTPPPLAEGQEISLSVGGLDALAGAIDALRDRLFSSLSGREPTVEYHFDLDDVRHQLEAGAEHNDARWLVTLLRILAPPYVSVPPEAVASGFDELVTGGIIRSENGQWMPEQPLLSLASRWRSPLPAVAHEVIETSNGEMRRYDHRITIRGDGPLTLIDYQDLVSEDPAVSINSVDAAEYLDRLTQLLQPGGDDNAAEWVYVLDPVEVRGLQDTEVVVGSLQPGTWYLLVSEEGAWARVADPDGRLEGWAPATQVRRPSDPVEAEPTLEPESTPASVDTGPAWSATHIVPTEGLQAWAEPDPAGQVTATLASEVELQVTERRADWAHVHAENGWEAWVDGRRLVPVGLAQTIPGPTPKPAAVAGTTIKGLIDPSALLDKKFELGAVVAVLVSAFLPWAGSGGNAFDLPFTFLLTADESWGGPSLGVLLLVVAVAAAGTVIVRSMERYQLIAGGVAAGLATLFLVQLLRLLIDFFTFTAAIGSLFTDSFGVGPWLLLAGGIVLIVRR